MPDFPKPGILFYDITTLLKDRSGLKAVINALKEHYGRSRVDLVLGVEARGFVTVAGPEQRLVAVTREENRQRRPPARRADTGDARHAVAPVPAPDPPMPRVLTRGRATVIAGLSLLAGY